MATQTIDIDGYVPPRAPQQATVSLDTTPAVHLGASITWLSHAGYRLRSTSAWYVGDASGQEELVAANEVYYVPSGSLATWYAKSASGTIALVVTGARKS
jgi:hypothetical protein